MKSEGYTDMQKETTVLIIATLDTKEKEALYLREQIQSRGCKTILMDAGILAEPSIVPDVERNEVAKAGGASIDELVR
jgi:uncharacterized protein (UPF0261 family)